MTKKIKEEDLWCEYSDMPSPLAYTKNEGDVENYENKKNEKMRRMIQKFTLWLSFKFPKKGKKKYLGFIKLI
jgi:hypothetical protein